MIPENILKEVSTKYSIPIEVVKLVYSSYWGFIRTTIKELPLKENINEEEFNKLRTSFTLPGLGKLACTYDKLVGMRKRLEWLKENKKNERI